MRPLKLAIEAFGSYADRVEIDFVKLGQHGVFSITGPTGSGKTTIFDAMVFALYGVLPGKRETGDVRSHFAKAIDPTQVTFEFEVRGVSWTICRSPQQLRPKKRGEGEMVAPASTILERSDGTGSKVTSATEATSRITELIGLTANQFQQVVLLPQGEFEAVLKAKTTDRVELLRQLFPVEIYQSLTLFLKQESASKRADFEAARRGSEAAAQQIRTQFLEAFGQVPVGVENPWHSGLFDDETFDLTTVASRRSELDVLVESVRGLVDAAGTERGKAADAFTNVEMAVKAFDAWVENKEKAKGFPEAEVLDAAREKELDRLQELVGLIDHLEAHGGFERNLREAIAQEAEARSVLKDAWDERYGDGGSVDLEQLKGIQQTALAELTALKNASSERNELKELAGEISDLEADGEGAEQAVATYRAGELEGKTRLQELHGLMKEGRAELKSLEKRRDERNAAIKVEGEVKKRDGLNAELGVAEATLAAEELRHGQFREALKELEEQYRAGLSGELARTLEVGEPCPTCGSCEHPKPAKVRKSSPTLAELEIETAKFDVALKKLQKAETAAQVLRSKLEEITSPASAEEAQRARELCDAEVERLEGVQDEVDRFEVEQEALRAELEKIKAKLDEAKAKQTTNDATVKAKEKELHRRTTKFEKAHGPLLEFTFDEGAFQTFLDAVGSFLQSSDALASAEHVLSQSLKVFAQQLVTHGVETAEELRRLALSSEELARERKLLSDQRIDRAAVAKAIVDYEVPGYLTSRPDLEEVKSARDDANAHYDEVSSRLTLIRNCGERIDTELGAIANSEVLIAETRRAYEETNTLYLMCSGQNAGNNEMKVSLEDWVLSYYFKQVLAQANVRLSKMTNGRYTLQVNTTGGDAKSRHGLDVEVFDTHTGRARSARTLSGGETFMSALALALGLADVVAGRNHELQALFIDEGFGSLDEDTLEQVLAILEGLQGGGRVVGVISHVEELKRILPQGIEVEGTDKGSRVTLHYPGE